MAGSDDNSHFQSTFDAALVRVEQGDYSPALRLLNRAIAESPAQRLAECYSVRGFTQLKMRDFIRAEEDCTEAISLNWSQAQTYAWRAAARGEQNKWRLAFDDLDQACEIAGPMRDQYLSLMESYAETASSFFREQIAAGNASADLFFERGWVYLCCGKYQRAERDFRHAFQEKKEHPWAAVGLAALRIRQEITSGVLELCNTGTKGNAECQQRALGIRAELNYKTGNLLSLKRDLQLLAKLAHEEAHDLVDVARLYSRFGDSIGAIDLLNNVLAETPNRPLALLVRGDCFHEIRNYGLAINDYSSYLKLFPDAVDGLVKRGRMYRETKHLAAAKSDLQRAIAVDETDFAAHLEFSIVHREEDRLDEALNQCRMAVSLDNHRPEAYAVLASIYNRLCDYGNAIEEFSRAIELSHSIDDKAQYSYLRGIAFYELENYDSALTDFKTACHDRPNHAGSWIWKAATCARMETWADAILGLQQAILVRPSAAEQYQKLGRPVAENAIEFFNRQQQRGHRKPELFRNRGLAHQFLGDHAEAIKDYTEAFSQEPDDDDTLIRRGQAFTQTGDFQSAIKDFTKILKHDKHNHKARYGRAIANLAAGNTEAVQTDLKRAIKEAPDHPHYHVLLGELFQKTGQRDEAIAAFDRAILQDPSNPNSYRRRGFVHLDNGRHLQAISDFTRSLELNSLQFDLLVQRGQIYLKTQQPEMAIQDFELALTHNDRLAKAYAGRATALVSQNRHEYALIWLTKAIHRFSDPRELAEIVFARGKVFYQMGRSTPAIADFTTVIELMREGRKIVAAARYARAIAEIHNQKFEAAARDFRKLIVLEPHNDHFRTALSWLTHRDQPIPSFLNPPNETQRPTRPPVVRKGVALSDETMGAWKNEPPNDAWILRNADKKEYGPVHLQIIETWAGDGRLDFGMKILRADWSQWQRVEKVFPEITPVGRIGGLVEEFPDLNIGSVAERHISNDKH